MRTLNTITRICATLLLLSALATGHANTSAQTLTELPNETPYNTNVTLITNYEGIQLNDALNLLAASAGITLITNDIPIKTVQYRFEEPTPFHEIINLILHIENLTATPTSAALIIQPRSEPEPTTDTPDTSENTNTDMRFYTLERISSELPTLINGTFPDITLREINNGRNLIIEASPATHERIELFIRDYNITITEGSLPTAFIPVDRGLSDLLPLLAERYPGVSVSPVESARAINATGTSAELELIRAFIDEYLAFLTERNDDGALELDAPLETSERTYRISNATSSEIASTIQRVLTIEGDGGEGFSFVADDRTNKLIVRAPEPLFERVEALIAELDEATRQVRVTVRIQEIAQRQAESMGLSITANAGAIMGSVVNGAAQFVFDPLKAITALNVSAVLDVLEAQNLSRTLDNATLVVANNSSATLNSGGNITVAVQIGDGDTATTEDRSISFGTNVTVTPRITNDDRIDLNIASSVSGFEGELTRLTGLRFSDKSINTNVVINNREVLVIGGLIQNSFTTSSQGVPIISAIPIIGGLFRNESAEQQRSELVIVITAEILEDALTQAP